MNNYQAPFSPASVTSNEWSGVSKYQPNERPYSPSVNSNNSRTNLITPPTSASGISGLNGSMSNGMARRPNGTAGNPSPPNSIARSSNGTTLSSEGQRRKASIMEDSLSQHYSVLKRFLAQSLRDEKGNPRPNKARDKLLRLSPVQFQELSTDVYDELLRRQTTSGKKSNESAQVPDHLMPKDNFHPKRNQARQKLSTLPPTRFKDLATDVFYELERRFPHFAGGEIERRGSPAESARGPPSRTGTPNGVRSGSKGQGSRRPYPPRQGSLGGQVFAGLGIPGIGAQDEQYGRPTAKSSQSNTIIPNKSTLVEDDDDQTGPEDSDSIYGLRTRSRKDPVSDELDKKIADYQEKVSGLQGKLDRLEEVVKEKDVALEGLYSSREEAESSGNADRSQWSKLQLNLEGKLADALNLNKGLQSELEKARAYNSENEKSLRSQIDQLANKNNGSSEWKLRYDDLQQDHQELQRELRDQQEVTEEVRRDASMFLNEMRTISERHDQKYEREERLVQQVNDLEKEIREWKSRYARTKTQLRTLRTSSVGLLIDLPNAGQCANDIAFVQPDGLIKDFHVTKFQLALDDVLRTARVGESQTVLDSMKMVVHAVKHILRDVNDAPTSTNDEAVQQRVRLPTKVSATANNFITASKNFSLSKGLSPVSLLDAAASHLASAVVDLVRTFKIHPTPTDELEDDDDESLPAGSPGYFSVTNGRPSIAESLYSPLSGTAPFASPPNEPNKAPGIMKALPSTNGFSKFAPTALAPKLGFGLRARDSEIGELKMFLEEQTEALVQSIQALVTSVRVVDEPEVVRDRIGRIIQIIGHVVKETERVMDTTGNTLLQNFAGPAMRVLGGCKSRLVTADEQGKDIVDHGAWKEFANTLPPLAFEIARETKELVQGVDRVLEDEREEEDFR